MNIYLNHFPKHEKYALANKIRNSAYEVYDLIVEGQKRYHKKTTLTTLDITHEQCRMQLYLAYELGYFRFKDGKRADDEDKIEEQRWTTISRLVDVMMLFADDGNEVGIPIGNLLSQTYALIYLDKMDHFIKRTLKVKKYCRYVDDFILFDLSREECLQHKATIEQFLKDELRLEYSKWTLQKVRRGINFVGYRTWKSARFIRKFSLQKFRRAVIKGKSPSIISMLGHAKFTNSLRWMISHLRKNWQSVYGANPAVVAERWVTT